MFEESNDICAEHSRAVQLLYPKLLSVFLIRLQLSRVFLYLTIFTDRRAEYDGQIGP
jgi:hypothetical protein